MNLERFEKNKGKYEIQECFRTAEELRSDKINPTETSMAEVVKSKYSLEWDSFLDDLGINPNVDTVENLVTTGELDVKWIIPEIYRTALRAGYRKAPIWPTIVAAEEQTTGLSQVIPTIEMSDAAPRRLGEGETIPLGKISYGSKSFRIWKMGRGIAIPYEVKQYSSLKVVSIFLEDFGLKLGHAMDTLAISTIINGDLADGSEAAPVIGVQSTLNGFTYADLLKIWVRMARIGRIPDVMLGGEAIALKTLALDEFKKPVYGAPEAKLNLVNVPIPSQLKYFVHGLIPTNQQILIDPSRAMLKFNAQPLLVESEKIVSNQTEAFYASITTGFVKLFHDASLIIDQSKDFNNANGLYDFPSFMNLDALQQVDIN